MRALATVWGWRWPQRLAFGAVFLAIAVHDGLLPAPREAAARLAALFDPDLGRGNALILVFSTLFLGPFALFLTLLAIVCTFLALNGCALALVRRCRLPHWTASAVALGGVGVLAWLTHALWLPRSLWFLGLLARACRLVFA